MKVIQFSKLIPDAIELLPDLEDDSRKETCFIKAHNISLNF